MSETQTVAPANATGTDRTVDVFDASGTATGSTVLPGHLFDVTANIPLIHQVVVAQLAAARQGTSKVKTRAEVSGGGTKPHRQKGTGRARQGSIRAPQYVGGGVVHGPTPRSYVQRTPKKMIAAALRGALSDRARDGRVHVVSELVSGDVPSTKSALGALSRVTSTDKVLVVLHRDDDLAWISLRNVVTVHVIAVDQLNAYDVLVCDEVVFSQAALDAFVAGPVSGRSAKATARASAAAEPSNAELAPEVIAEPSNAELAPEVIAEPSNAELAPEVTAEPSNAELGDELPAASVEGSAEPSNADLAASAATVAEVLEPSEDLTDAGEPVVGETAEPVDPEEDAK
jgi:large subunit ribosomal protein L4